MPTLQDLVNEVNQTHKEMSDKVDLIDKEQKKIATELASKTANLDGFAEWKIMFERQNSRINELMDHINDIKQKSELARIESQRPPLNGNGKKERSAAHQAFMKAIRNHGKVYELSNEEKSLIVYNYMPQEQKALYAGDATTGKQTCPHYVVQAA